MIYCIPLVGCSWVVLDDRQFSQWFETRCLTNYSYPFKCWFYNLQNHQWCSISFFLKNHIISFILVAQSCPTLCNPMDCSMPGFPVHHQLWELAQTHVHWVSDAIQPSHPLSSNHKAIKIKMKGQNKKWRIFLLLLIPSPTLKLTIGIHSSRKLKISIPLSANILCYFSAEYDWDNFFAHVFISTLFFLMAA